MFDFFKQAPEAEEGGSGQGPNWKWIVGILVAITGFAGSFYINMVQGQFKDQDEKAKVLHARINKLDEDKVDEKTLTQCLKRIDEKLDLVIGDLTSLKKMHQKQ